MPVESKPGKRANPLKRVVSYALKIMYAISAMALVCLMLLVAADVGLRYFFNLPILGTVEITEFLMLALVFFGMLYTQQKKSHVIVEALVERFSQRTQAVIKSITTIAAISVFFIISWQSVVRAGVLKTGNYLSRYGTYPPILLSTLL